MHIDEFDYYLPDELIAQSPLEKRDASRLVVYKSGSIAHEMFSNLPNLLPPGTLLIRNSTQVFPSRIYGTTETGAHVEIFLLRQIEMSPTHCQWEALARPLKRLRIGTKVTIDPSLTLTVGERMSQSSLDTIVLSIPLASESFYQWLSQNGKIPLPPYIKRPTSELDTLDRERYQTHFARLRGSVAAPTAGLHFTKEVDQRLIAAGVQITEIVLHVGAGTFLPVKVEDIEDHHMHSELFMIPKSSAEKILQCLSEGRPLVCVGTTSLRALEAWFLSNQKMDEWQSTNLFIRPQTADDLYKTKISAILTNFHQPKSTLFILMSALLGGKNLKRIYKEAIKEKYRFLSYGDCGLFWL